MLDQNRHAAVFAAVLNTAPTLHSIEIRPCREGQYLSPNNSRTIHKRERRLGSQFWQHLFRPHLCPQGHHNAEPVDRMAGSCPLLQGASVTRPWPAPTAAEKALRLCTIGLRIDELLRDHTEWSVQLMVPHLSVSRYR